MQLETLLSVHLSEVPSYARLKILCLYVTGTISKCPLMEVSAYRRCPPAEVSLYQIDSSLLNSAESNTVTMYGRGFEKFNSAESHSVRCGFKFNNTYRQGMLCCKVIMTTESLVQSNTFIPTQGNFRISAF